MVDGIVALGRKADNESEGVCEASGTRSALSLKDVPHHWGSERIDRRPRTLTRRAARSGPF